MNTRYMEVEIANKVLKHHSVLMFPQTPDSKGELWIPWDAVSLDPDVAKTILLDPLQQVQLKTICKWLGGYNLIPEPQGKWAIMQ